jgi:hypothetical protein
VVTRTDGWIYRKKGGWMDDKEERMRKNKKRKRTAMHLRAAGEFGNI